jgi:hypothetical protein
MILYQILIYVYTSVVTCVQSLKGSLLIILTCFEQKNKKISCHIVNIVENFTELYFIYLFQNNG